MLRAMDFIILRRQVQEISADELNWISKCTKLHLRAENWFFHRAARLPDSAANAISQSGFAAGGPPVIARTSENSGFPKT